MIFHPCCLSLLPVPASHGHHDVQGSQAEHQVEHGVAILNALFLVVHSPPGLSLFFIAGTIGRCFTEDHTFTSWQGQLTYLAIGRSAEARKWSEGKQIRNGPWRWTAAIGSYAWRLFLNGSYFGVWWASQRPAWSSELLPAITRQTVLSSVTTWWFNCLGVSPNILCSQGLLPWLHTYLFYS